VLRRIIRTDRAPKAIGPYSQAVDLGDFVFVSGQIPIDPATQQLVSGDIGIQTDRVLKNLRAILEEAELSLADVVRTTVFLQDLGESPAMNEVYATHFPQDPPARSTLQVAALPKGARIEIDAIARR